MMADVVLAAEKREIRGKKVKVLRREGKIPGILYGSGIDPTPITMDYRTATRTLANVTRSSLVQVELEGESFPTLIRERQRDVLSGNLLHIDFQVVSLTELVTTRVSIEYVGESPAVKTMNGILVSGIEYLDVEGLPQDLPSQIQVDISILDDYGSSIQVRDLVISDKVTVFNDLNETVVLVTGRDVLEEEEEEELEEELIEGAEEPEVIEKGKREEDEDEEE